MSQHFRWYPQAPEVVAWNARYPFPSVANKAVKSTPRIQPKSGATFTSGGVIAFDFPAQGYIDPGNTYIEFDVEMHTFPNQTHTATGQTAAIRFQNNIQSIFSRCRILYGSTTLEDIPEYNVIVRALTEWTSSSQQDLNQTSITEGIGGLTTDPTGRQLNTRQAYIQGICYENQAGTAGNRYVPNGEDGDPVSPATHVGATTTRRYCISLAAGLLNQEKLLPTKFMGSQLQIELTLAPPLQCMIWKNVAGSYDGTPKYIVKNVNLIPEMLDFAPSYDASFMQGLAGDGVPIKFASWNHYAFPCTGSVQNLQIYENSKSIKSIFVLLRRAIQLPETDAGAFLYSTNETNLVEYQFRFGGRYFPAAPVQCTTTNSLVETPQGSEAYMELAKALNMVGDYRLSTFANPLSFGVKFATQTDLSPGNQTYAGEGDYQQDFLNYNAAGTLQYNGTTLYSGKEQAGNIPSSNFCMATSLESSNGFEVAGLNGEEQSSISLITKYSGGQDSVNFQFEVFVHYDAMIVLKENNVIELIK